MDISVKHLLGQREAKNRILKFSEILKKDFGTKLSNYEEKWTDNNADISFKIMGMNISGVINILSDKVTLSGKVPLLAKAFEGEIEKTIKQQLSELLIK